MNIQRLTRLVKILRRVDAAHFNIITYLSNEASRGHDVETTRHKLQHNCGATACALGYASVDPVLMVEGLRRSSSGCPIYGQDYGKTAACKFFGIKTLHATALFYPFEVRDQHKIYYTPNNEITPNMVADKIQELIDTGYLTTAYGNNTL